MITLTIAAILLFIAAPSFVAFKRNSELTSATNGLVGAIAAARGEALKRGMSALVMPVNANDWASGWNVFVDTNNNQQLDATEIPIYQQGAMPSYITVTGKGTVLTSLPYIMFDPSGYNKTSTAVFQSITLTVSRTDVSTAEQSDQTRIIVIAKTGRVRACRPSTDTTCTADATE